MPSPVPAILDANILFSNVLRNLLLQLALNEAFEAWWTVLIEDEWLRNMEDRTRDRIRERTLPLIRKHFPNAIVSDFDVDVDQAIGKTNPKDPHVADAAVAIAPCVLVTNNLKDFDADELAELGVRVLSPDDFDFLVELFDASPDFVETATREAAANLSTSMPSRDEYLTDLAIRAGLKRFAERLRSLDHDLTRYGSGQSFQRKSTPRFVRTASETAVTIVFLILRCYRQPHIRRLGQPLSHLDEGTVGFSQDMVQRHFGAKDYDRATDAHCRPDKPWGATGKSLCSS